MQATLQRGTYGLHASGCKCSSCQHNAIERTVLDEIMQEVYQPASKSHSNCFCHYCTQARQQNELEFIQQELSVVASGLSSEEELELGKALIKIKQLAKKGMRKASHPAFALLLKLASVFNPHQQIPPRPEQTLDYSKYAEEEKRRRREDAMQQAIRNKKPKVTNRPQ